MVYAYVVAIFVPIFKRMQEGSTVGDYSCLEDRRYVSPCHCTPPLKNRRKRLGKRLRLSLSWCAILVYQTLILAA